MATAPVPLLLLALTALMLRVRGDDGDFDLADALDPDPTSQPSLYPKLPADPLPSDPHGGGGVYPPPRPRPRPQPRPQPSDTEGLGGSGDHSSHDMHGDGEGAQGNTVARIVSPIVSVVAVALVGAGVSYFRSGRWRACLRRGDPGTI